MQEKLRNKIITRLLQEGSKADEPTNIKLSDYSRQAIKPPSGDTKLKILFYSDEGDTSSSSSNEDYKRMCEEIPFSVPPPSPAVQKKTKNLKDLKKKQQSNKSPSINRRPLHLCQATLELAVSKEVTRMFLSESSSDSNSDSESNMKMKVKPRRRRKKKKKKKQKAMSLWV